MTNNARQLLYSTNERTASPLKSIPVSEWVLPSMPQVVTYYDKVLDKTLFIETAANAWKFWYNGTPLWVRFERFHPAVSRLIKHAGAYYVQTSGKTVELSKITRLYNHDLRRLLESPLVEVETWWAADEQIATRTSIAMPMRRLLRFCIDLKLGHWALASRALINSLGTKPPPARDIQSRELLIASPEQASIIRLLDDNARECSKLETEELAGLVSVAWSFQHGMRAVQQITVRLKDVRLYTDAGGKPQAHLVFHKAKQRGEQPEPLIRQMKCEWVPLLSELLHRRKTENAQFDQLVLGFRDTSALEYRQKVLLRAVGIESLTPSSFRHTAAQTLADAGHPRELIQQFLGHSSKATAQAYIQASNSQAHSLNEALGASRVYGNIHAIATGRFASVAEIEAASEEKQIGAMVGVIPIAGLGLCSSGQPNCPYNPVTSCYGCPRFIPVSNTKVHEAAIDAMRQQVVMFERSSRGEEIAPAYVQLKNPIAMAQQTLEALRQSEANHD